jgi:hypothetical protein
MTVSRFGGRERSKAVSSEFSVVYMGERKASALGICLRHPSDPPHMVTGGAPKEDICDWNLTLYVGRTMSRVVDPLSPLRVCVRLGG